MAARKIRKGDTVRVITGVDKGKEGKVIELKKGKVKVEGVHVVKRHLKASQRNTKGGIIEQEAFFDISNVMYVMDGNVTRVGFKIEDGNKVRIAKSNGAIID
ncbi:MAG: 50S ribosomal protein L24 [Lachnoclostridium sp.]|nr:50S ribosomal protein L24 [Lachnoclostridium sp.]